VALGGVVGHVAGPAVDLDVAVGDPAQRFGVNILQQARERDVLSPVLGPGRLEHRGSGGHQIAVESAIVAWTSWNSAIGRPNRRRVMAWANTSSRMRSANPVSVAEIRGAPGRAPASPRGSPGPRLRRAGVRRHRAVGEDHVGDRGPLLAHPLLFGADREAGDPSLDQEGADPGRPLTAGSVRAMTVNRPRRGRWR